MKLLFCPKSDIQARKPNVKRSYSILSVCCGCFFGTSVSLASLILFLLATTALIAWVARPSVMSLAVKFLQQRSLMNKNFIFQILQAHFPNVSYFFLVNPTVLSPTTLQYTLLVCLVTDRLNYFLALKYVFLKCVFWAVWPYCSFRMRQATYDKEDTIWASAKYGKLSIDRLPNLSISFQWSP